MSSLRYIILAAADAVEAARDELGISTRSPAMATTA